ncbi:hypothetical protein MPSEU_001064200 [Mayamaea pseudoterrestris]|nr:hypothetical protein MPSEU_001064200 [Mayamaea pseudoterrestris]
MIAPTKMLRRSVTGSSLSSAKSTVALQRLFAWIEDKFGGLPIDEGPAAEVITSTQSYLSPADLHRLFTHQATAIHVRGFFPKTAAKTLGEKLTFEYEAGLARNWKVSTSRGLESSDVSTLGAHDPFNIVSADASTDKRDDYFEGVSRELQNRRVAEQSDGTLLPQLWPLDLLRLQLDEAWSEGAGLAREHLPMKRPFGGGLTRVMKGPTRWNQGFIHVDEMGPLDPNQGLFSANIYLQLPRHHKDENVSAATCHQETLRIWPVGVRSRWDWYRNALLLSGLSSQDPEAQMRLRTALGQAQTIAVEPGDLVLICAQRRKLD